MKKLVLLFSALFLTLFTAQAQEAETPADTSLWKVGGMGSLTYNEVGLFNWTAGGQSNMTLIGNFNIFANRATEVSSWENSLDLAYGFIKNNFIFDPDAPITKAEDRIDLNSKYGRKAWNDKVYYSGLFNFRSQFDFGRQNPFDQTYISRFMAPGYAIFALGLDYKPNDKFSIFFSPASGKATFVLDDSLANTGAFGVNQFEDPADPSSGFRNGNSLNARIEIGATFRAKYKADVVKNVGLESQLELFSNYIDRPQNVDIRWNNAIVARINKYITVNLFTDLIYDHDINVNLVNSEGLPIYSVNPDPILNPETNQFETNTTYWPGANYPQAGNPQPDDDTSDVIQIQRKGPRIQFKQIFGLGFVYKF